jgi:hypothetical protein
MNQIIIIGTVPPCPRCGVLTDIVSKKIEIMGLDAQISHIAYTSDEAKKIAAKIGLIPGTAKDVAKRQGEEIDLSPSHGCSQAKKESEELEPDLQQFAKEYAKASILDKRLRSYENMAYDLGILMTPVLIINDVIKHQGSVPSLSDLDQWLRGLK